MATLQDIFNEVQYGKEYCKFQQIKNSILENYNAETDIFSASGRIRGIAKCMALNEEQERIVDHICNKIESVEKRLYNEDDMSPQYKKIQSTSIMEDCGRIVAKANKRGTYETLAGKKEFAQIVATAKYFTENYLDPKAVLKESTNAEFNKLIKEEEFNIEQVL